MIYHVTVIESSVTKRFEEALAAAIDAIQRNGMRAEVQTMHATAYAALVLAHQDS